MLPPTELLARLRVDKSDLFDVAETPDGIDGTSALPSSPTERFWR